MQRQVTSIRGINYQTGWCYQNQLQVLNTCAPHILQEATSLPQGVDP